MASKNDKYKRYCCVYGCLNKSRNRERNDFTFHLVPQDDERKREWLKAIDREDLLEKKNKKNFICSVHFDESALERLPLVRLKSDAVPTKLLPHKADKSVDVEPDESEESTSNKNNSVVSTYSHTATQTDTQKKVVKTQNPENESKNQTTASSKAPSASQSQKKIVRIISNKKNKVDSSKFTSTFTQTDPDETSEDINSQAEVSTFTHVKIKLEPMEIEIEPMMDTSYSTAQTNLNETSDDMAQTTSAISDKTSCKRNLEKEIEIVKSKYRRLEQEFSKVQKELQVNKESLLSNSEDEVDQRFKKIIEWQNKIKGKFEGNRYRTEDKIFALNFYFASPQAYCCLQNFLNLPKKSKLNGFYLEIPTKFDDNVLKSLSLKMKSLPANAKYCTICIDEIQLTRNLDYNPRIDAVIGYQDINGTRSKEIATSAYVIMLKGMYCNFDQPIAYSFFGNTKNFAEIDSWINDIILKLFSVGIVVKAIISNQSSDFEKYAKDIKNITVDKPYFFVDEHKIYYIFDVPHLMECVRDNLILGDFDNEGDKISWEHIKTLYEHQKDRNLRLIPKITNAHLEPSNIKRMGEKYAPQIFSNTVAAALETYIDFGKIPVEARATVKFIKTMNDLFDVLNSSKIESSKPCQTPLRVSSEQETTLQDAQYMFATMESTSRTTGEKDTNKINTFHNFQISIQSVSQLLEDKDIQSEHLFTGRLNLDSLETFFESVKQQAGPTPEPHKFLKAFSKLFYKNMLKTDQMEFEADIYEILDKAEDIIKNV